MASATALAQHRKKLASASPVLALQGVAGITHTLSSSPAALGSEAGSQAIAACLGHEFREVVEEACRWLLAASIPWRQAQDLLLGALAGTGAKTSAVLAEALCQAYCAHALTAGPAAASPLAWTQHPLSSALLLNPGIAPQLLSSCCGALHREAAAKGHSATSLHPAAVKLWSHVEPFFIFVLLQRGVPLSHLSASSASIHTLSASGSAPAAGCWALLPELLQQQLVRLACRSPMLALPVLRLLTQALMCSPLGSDTERARALQGVDTVMDLIETLPQAAPHISAGLAGLLPHLYRALVSLAHEMRSMGGDSLSVPLRALLRLHQLMQQQQQQAQQGPGEAKALQRSGQVQGTPLAAFLVTHASSLALLLNGATTQEQEQLHALLHEVLGSSEGSVSHAPDHALSQLQLLCCLAYGTSPKAKQWSSHLLHGLEDSLALTPSAVDPTPCHSWETTSTWHGELRMLQQTRYLLCAAGYSSPPTQQYPGTATAVATAATVATVDQQAISSGDTALKRWLLSLACQLHILRTSQQPGSDGASSSSSRGDLPASALGGSALTVPLAPSRDLLPGKQGPQVPEVGPGAEAALAAALLCPDPSTRVVAAMAAQQLLLLRPLASLTLLPLLLRRSRNCSHPAPPHTSTQQWRSAEATAQLALLQLLPAMAADASVAPLAARALAPLQAEGAPLLLRCLSMRLTVHGWLLTGRGWPRVEAAINGYAPQDRAALPPLELRLTRASLIKSVVLQDPFKGLELVCALQESVLDPSPCVAALGLQSMTVMCETDVLDFYKAWQVVQRRYPALPSHPLLASAWVGLLAGGALDAQAHPERAQAVLQALWAATQHPHPPVRAEAYKALAAYPLDLVEKLERDQEAAEGDKEEGQQDAGAAMLEAIDLDGYVRPLAGAADGVAGGTGPEADGAALQNAEALACLALQHEHENRRRFLAAAAAAAATAGGGNAGTAAGGADASSQGQAPAAAAAAAAATAREAAALRHRLGSTLPSALQLQHGPLATSAAASPGPSLLLYTGARPAPPAPGKGAKGPGSQQQQVHAGFALRLREALGRAVSWSDWPYAGPLLLRSWQALFTRWIQANEGNVNAIWSELATQWGCEAPATPGSPGPSQAAPLPPPPAVLESAPLAAAALAAACAAAVDAGSVNATACSNHIDWALGQVLSHLQPGAQRPRAVLQSCATATATIASLLHPTDQAGRSRALAALHRLYSEDAGQGHAVRGAAALSIAALAASASAELPGWSQPPSPQQQQIGTQSETEGPTGMLKSALGLLLGGLAAQSPSWCNSSLVPAMQQLATAAPQLLQPLRVALPQPHKSHAGSKAPPGGAQGGAPRQEEEEEDGQAQHLQGLLSGLCLLLSTQAAPRASPAGGQAEPLLSLLHATLAHAASEGSNMLGLTSADGPATGKALGAGVSGAISHQLAVLLGCLPFTSSSPQASVAMQGQKLGEHQGQVLELLKSLAASTRADGVVRGAAALALASVAALQAPSTTLGAASGASAAAVPPAVAALRGVLEPLLALAQEEPKGSHASRARMGALAGLTVVLIGSDSVLLTPPGAATAGPAAAGALAAASGRAAAAVAPGLLQHAGDAPKAARTAIKALEAAASEPGTDGRAAAAAAWMLAELCERFAARTAADAAASALGGSGAAGGRVGVAASGAGAGAGSGGRVAAVAAGRLIPLASYPPAGAHRPLVDAVANAAAAAHIASAVKGSDASAFAAVAAVAAALRCLAASPRLPAWDWGSACRRLWAQAEAALSSSAPPPSAASDGTQSALAAAAHNGVESVIKLQEAILRLVLSHGTEPGHGLATLLDELVAGAGRGLGLGASHPRVQARFLRQLPQAAACLAASRGDALLGGLLPMLQQHHFNNSSIKQGISVQGSRILASGVQDSGGPSWGLVLLDALWEGLAGMLKRSVASGGRQAAVPVSGTLGAVLTGALQLLPDLPALLPGEAAWAAGQLRHGAVMPALSAASRDEAGSSGAMQGSGQDSQQQVAAQPQPAHRQRHGLAVWCRAAAGLVAAGVHTATSLLESMQRCASGAGAMQMRCLLALAGTLSYRDLAVCRSAFVQLPEADADSLACLLAEALATAPQAAQVQMVQEALESARSATHPQRALALAAVLVAAWQAQGQGAAGAMSQHVCLADGSGSLSSWAVDSLPSSLPALLHLPQWSPSLPSITSLLLQLLERGSALGARERQVLLATLLGLRLQADASLEFAGGARGPSAEVYRMLARESGALVPAVGIAVA